VAPPLELYDNPVNLYTADFIGNPSINFVKGTATVDASGMVTESSVGQVSFDRADMTPEAPQSGKLDITLQPTGRRETEDFAQTLLQWLKDNGGECPLGDKSDAEDIKRMFQVSKKTFKRAVGALYKQHLIVLEGNGFRLTTED
ncbi:MAG: hypothetical protein ACOCOK_02290, partial [Prevotella sp.]